MIWRNASLICFCELLASNEARGHSAGPSKEDFVLDNLHLGQLTTGLARVVGLGADPVLERRLKDLGLHVGARVELVHHAGQAGVVVAVNGDTRLSLDAGLAAAVQVRSLEPAPAPTTLAVLRPGDRARVVGFGKGASDYRRRLMAMGLTPGVELRITRIAPLGDPVELQVRGFAMSLRRGEAELLQVEKLS